MEQLRSKNILPLHKTRVAIVGNPNVGKSTLFNKITKSYSLVANFPYTTITVLRADITIAGKIFEIIDTPGILSLDTLLEKASVTRDILLREPPEVIILCLDATNIKKSLVLASQIFELDIPIIASINLAYEARQMGIVISKEKLQKLLAVPVIEADSSGVNELKELLKKPRTGALQGRKICYRLIIEKGLDELLNCFPPADIPSAAEIILLMQNDPGTKTIIGQEHDAEVLEKVKDRIKQISGLTKKPLSRLIFEAREKWAHAIDKEVVEKHYIRRGKTGEIIGALARHPVYGWFILAGILFIIYMLVGRIGAGILSPFIEQKILSPINSTIGEMIPWSFAREFAVGEYGILTTGLANAVGTVVPILALFFLVLNFLEDCGYIPNLCVLSSRVFKCAGLSGNAIMPIVLGFGCKTLATLTTKILESRKERYIAVFLIAFAIPCAPQLGINMAILSLFSFKSFFIAFGFLAGIEILAGVALNRMFGCDKYEDFILEIPPIRLPNIKNLFTKTYYRIKWFLAEAVPLFMAGACIIFVLDKLSILNFIKRLFSPVIVSILNLPIITVDAFLLRFARHEAGAVMLLKLAENQQLDYKQAIVGTVTMTCIFPCIANIMSMINELGIRSALLMVFIIIIFSVMAGGILNLVLSIL